MDTERKEQIMSALNSNVLRTETDDVQMGLGYCNVRCLRTKNTPGSYLSKNV